MSKGSSQWNIAEWKHRFLNRRNPQAHNRVVVSYITLLEWRAQHAYTVISSVLSKRPEEFDLNDIFGDIHAGLVSPSAHCPIPSPAVSVRASPSSMINEVPTPVVLLPMS